MEREGKGREKDRKEVLREERGWEGKGKKRGREGEGE